MPKAYLEFLSDSLKMQSQLQFQSFLDQRFQSNSHQDP